MRCAIFRSSIEWQIVRSMRERFRSQPSSLIEQLKGRLIFIVGLLVLCLVLTSVIGVLTMLNQQQLGDQKVAMNNDVNNLLQAMIDQETGLRGYITTANASFLAPYTSGQSNYNAAVKQLQTDAKGPNFHATALALITVQQRASDWSDTFATVELQHMQAGDFTIARSDTVNAQGKTLFDRFRNAVTQLQQATKEDLATIQTQANGVDFVSLGTGILLTVLALLWLWYTFVRFATAQREQLNLLKDAAEAFGAGNLAMRVHGVTDADLSDVGQTFNTMAETLERQQNALGERDILEHVLQLNTILTESLQLEELTETFLRRVLMLLNVQLGMLYLYDTSDKILRLYNVQGMARTDIPESFALGEGPVGQAAHERQPVFVAMSEQDASKQFQVKTVLGHVVPSSMYHLPLLQGESLVGVLVVGSIFPMREQTRNTLQVVASMVASAIRNTQAYGRIQEQATQLEERAREQEQANQALRQQRDELTALNIALQEANQARSRFLSTMSHELRTPLTSIIGFAQILLRPTAKTALSERQAGNIERILKNAQHLLTLINDVLDLAKVEAGRMDVQVAKVNLRELLQNVAEQTRSMATERKLHVSVHVPDEAILLETDPVKLRQIMLNLLSNALKFTEKGGVTISASLRTVPASEGRPAESQQIAIAVKDTGIGIAPEKQQHIFEAFYQVDGSNTRKYGGTGLGLSIVSEFTSLLGGQVEVESQQGVGTTFTILLPVRARDRFELSSAYLTTLHKSVQSERLNVMRNPGNVAVLESVAQSSTYQASQEEQEPMLIVAIDDNPDVLQLIAATLDQTPYRVVGVQDATKAVEVVKELKPQVVTLDIMMPQVNGWQILHQLKSQSATSTIPVILLTVLEDRSAGYVLGADEYLVKPVARETLLTTLQQLTAYNNGAVPAIVPLTEQEKQQVSLSQDSPSFKQLVVVQQQTNVRTLIEQLVQDEGYHLTMLDGGQELAALVERSSPDLLMLFVQLQKNIAESKEQKTIIEAGQQETNESDKAK